jgi:PBP1b-binding outer membrane lipoprotein LpoB
MKKIISLMVLLTFVLTSCGQAAEEPTTEIKPKYVKTQTLEKKIFAEDLKLI